MIAYRMKNLKQAFFTSTAVTKAVDAGERRALSRFGAFVRSDARKSIKRQPFTTRKKRGQERTNFARKKAGKGKPPGNITGKLKRNIYFFYSFVKKSVVTGPIYFSGARRDNLVMLEVGGQRQVKGVRQDYGIGNPFMKPAFDKNLPLAPGLFKDSIR